MCFQTLTALKNKVSRQYFVNARCCLEKKPNLESSVVFNGTQWRYKKQQELETIVSTGPTQSQILVTVSLTIKIVLTCILYLKTFLKVLINIDICESI